MYNNVLVTAVKIIATCEGFSFMSEVSSITCFLCIPYYKIPVLHENIFFLTQHTRADMMANRHTRRGQQNGVP